MMPTVDSLRKATLLLQRASDLYETHPFATPGAALTSALGEQRPEEEAIVLAFRLIERWPSTGVASLRLAAIEAEAAVFDMNRAHGR